MKRTAAIFLALLMMAAPAQALIVSAEVGPLIKEAQFLVKLNEAEAVKSSPDDDDAITSMRQYINVKFGGVQPLPEKTQP
jgi:hypothetical protein